MRQEQFFCPAKKRAKEEIISVYSVYLGNCIQYMLPRFFTMSVPFKELWRNKKFIFAE